MQHILYETFCTRKPDEVAFVHIPAHRISPEILLTRYGHTNVPQHGAAYTMTMEQLRTAFKGSAAAAKKRTWILDAPPFLKRPITSVVVPNAIKTDEADEVLAQYAPELLSGLRGACEVHFFSEADADAFCAQKQKDMIDDACAQIASVFIE